MLTSSAPEPTCPDWLLTKARRAQPVATAIVNAVNDVALQSARDATDAGIITPVLVGEGDAMKRAADSIGWDIATFEVIEANGEQAAAEAGAKAAGGGAVGALMKGHLHTDIFMRAALSRDAGLRIGKPLTHHFHLTLGDQPSGLIITDAALNPAPDATIKQAIITNAVALSKATGIARPKVALLSATEVPTDKVPSSVEARDLAAWARDHVNDADVDGPLAFDLAVSPQAVAIKGVTSPVAGAADIIVVPEIVSGNALYKAMVQYLGACAAGVVLGAKVPILLTSRADPPAARLASAALAGLMTP